MNKVISLPQEVCGVERYVVTQKPYNIFDKTICFVRLAEKCFYNIKSILRLNRMSEINANQYNTINYGGVVVTGNINSLTLVVKPEEEETCTCEEKITRDAEETAAVEKNINNTKQETKEMSVRETLYNLVQEAKEIFGSTPRDILKPYLVAVNMGLIPAMNVNAFNNYFGTNINKTTYCEGTSRDAIHKYAKDELDYYFAKLERFKTSVL